MYYTVSLLSLCELVFTLQGDYVFFVSLRDTNVSLRKEMWHFLTELNNYNLNVYIFLIESFCFSDLFSYSVPVLGVEEFLT